MDKSFRLYSCRLGSNGKCGFTSETQKRTFDPNLECRLKVEDLVERFTVIEKMNGRAYVNGK